MKINKFILKISHFFGFRKQEEHIDNIIINLPSNYKSNDYWSEEDWIVNDIKKQVYEELDKNPKLMKRCSNVGCVYVTFYKQDKRGVSLENCKELKYLDNTLYYATDKSDIKSYIRDSKLKSILS